MKYQIHYASLEWGSKLSFMTLKKDAKFEEKLTCGLESDIRNLAKFQQSTQKCQNWDFDGIFLSELHIYRGVICHDNEEWYKNWREIDLSF